MHKIQELLPHTSRIVNSRVSDISIITNTMFNHVGRNLTLSVFETTSVYSLFTRSLCSSPAASNNSIAVSYLIDSCGFPPDKAISASKYLKFKTPDRADSVIAFFKNRGFTETQISHLVRKFPRALTCNPEKSLLPKFEFLASIGFSDSDICKVLTARPNLLGRSLKNHIEPNYNILRDLLQSNDSTLIAFKSCVWYSDLDLSNVIPNMQILRDVGMPASRMMYFLTYHTRDFLVTTDQFKKAVEEVVEMGFDSLKITFMLGVHAIRSMDKSTWERKMKTYKKWGWSEAQILQAFRTNPWCMMTSEEKINKVMDFLVNKMGVETSFIAKNSLLISFSMEKRIIPRSLVYQYCLHNGFMKDINYYGISAWLRCSDAIFIKKLEKYETKSPGVLKFYQEKLDHVKRYGNMS